MINKEYLPETREEKLLIIEKRKLKPEKENEIHLKVLEMIKKHNWGGLKN